MIFSHIRRAIHLLVLTSMLILPSMQSARAAGNITILVSVNSEGVPGSSGVGLPSISANGRYIAFASYATNLAPGDTNNAADIFVRDTQTGVTTLASVNSDETLSNGDSTLSAISSDGRYVVFESLATNLAGQDENPFADIFVRDLQAGTTIIASVNSSNQQATGASGFPSISGDGRYVTFHTNAPLVNGDVNGYEDVFVRDIVGATTQLVSVNSGGVQGDSFSHYSSISRDGRYVVFESNATNLVDEDSNNQFDIFMRDLQTGTTTRVSVDSGEVEANHGSDSPAVSSNGQYIVFSSWASNLVSGDTNNAPDIFLRDTVAGITSRLSVSSNGIQGMDASESPRISSNGRYVSFTSWADNLVMGDTNTYPDVFVHDTTAGTTWRASVDSTGLQGNSTSWSSDISPDGNYVTFVSWATNLVSTTIEQGPQVFSHGPYIDAAWPTVLSSKRSNPDPTSAVSVNYTVTFSESVIGVDSTDFSLHVTGLITGAAIDTVSGSGSVYTITVNTGSGNGAIRLDIKDDDSIRDSSDNPLGGAGSDNGSFTGGQTYFVRKVPTFADVPTSHLYWRDIEILYANNMTGGCATSPLRYCPNQIMNRGQAAVFILRANKGSSYMPPAATHIFQDDWSKGTWAEPWAEGMRSEGFSAGCLASPLKYCPWDLIPREQAVIFALRMKYGKNYIPPPATGTLFADMTNPSYYATPWAEQAYKDGIIPNCGTSGGKPKICPNDLVSRGLGAYMIVRAKNLTMP